jgi:hypothetical protein
MTDTDYKKGCFKIMKYQIDQYGNDKSNIDDDITETGAKLFFGCKNYKNVRK